jgi:DNA-binding MarR family transcriptional regulator
LRRIEQAITGIGRIGGGKDAATVRAARSGVSVSRPGIAIMATLAHNGELRVGEIARLTHLESPLVSRELNRLVDDGYAIRKADPTDGRVACVSLSERGLAAYRAYRQATDDIIAETFGEWRSDELHHLAGLLERVLSDFARPPGRGSS